MAKLKTLEERFVDLMAYVRPDCQQGQYEDMRIAFYAGAHSMQNALLEIGSLGGAEEDLAAVALEKELSDYVKLAILSGRAVMEKR